MNRYRSCLRAFTLIEVLVSLAIFALAAVVLAAAYLNVIGGYQSVARRQHGDEEWKLVRSVVLTESDRKKVEDGGRLQLADSSYVHWTAKIEGTAVADLFAVTIRSEPEITTAKDGLKREQKLLLLRPRWSEPAEHDRLRAESQDRFNREHPR